MRSPRPRAERSAAFVAAALGVLASGCTDPVYACNADDQCVTGEALGICEPTGFCSFPDETCDSGRRYGAHAGDLADDCVPAESDESTGSPTTDTNAATTLAETTDPDSGPTSGPIDTGTTLTSDPGDSTDTSPTTDPTTDTGTMDDSGTTDDTGVPGCEPLLDDFERPDAPEIGNGWIEKHPVAFELVAGRVDFETDSWSYPNNLAYRPLDESALDVEVSLEVVFDIASPPEHPQVHVRVHEEFVDVIDALHSYVLFIEDTVPLTLAIARVDPNGDFGAYAETPLAEDPVVGVEYRLVAQVLGTDPVIVDGRWERLEGGNWIALTEVQLVDDGDGRIVDAGTVGFSGHGNLDHYTYDDFARNCP